MVQPSQFTGISDDAEFIGERQYPDTGTVPVGGTRPASAIDAHMGEFYVQQPHRDHARPFTPRRITTYQGQSLSVVGDNPNREYVILTTDQTNSDVVYITNSQTTNLGDSFGLVAGCNWLVLPTNMPVWCWSPSSGQFLYVLEYRKR